MPETEATEPYCAKDSDLDRLQGVEYDVIFLDEATQLSEHQMKVIGACVRGANDFPKRIYYTMNPGGQGHGYIKRIFIDRRFEEGENPEEYSFIQSLVTDNKALMAKDPDYVRQLEALPPKLREAWLYGRWDIFEGQFFEEFRDSPDPAKAYASPPLVVANIVSTSTSYYLGRCNVAIQSVTTTGFTARIANGGSSAVTFGFNWIAVGVPAN